MEVLSSESVAIETKNSSVLGEEGTTSMKTLPFKSEATATEENDGELSTVKSSNESDSEEEEDSIQLSDSLRMYHRKRLSRTSMIYCGQFTTGVFKNVKVAVKYLPCDGMYQRETEILKKISSHPNIARIYDSGEYKEGPYPAMYIAIELCKTQNLQDLFQESQKNKVPFDPELSLSQSKQVLLGLQFIHKNRVINRDLKPENVLISLDGQTLKLIGFGWSKPLRHGRSVTRQSLTGIGTDGYRAPETYNEDVISLESDIYSLALLFYFIWSYGCHPFGDDPDDWNSNIKKNRDRDLSKLLILRKDAALHLLEWMLQYHPKKRPKADEILEHPLFTGEGEISTPSSGQSFMFAERKLSMERLNPDKNTKESTEVEERTEGEISRPKPLSSGPTLMFDQRKLGMERLNSEKNTKESTEVEEPTEEFHQTGRMMLLEPKLANASGKDKDMESLDAILEEDECQNLMRESSYAKALLKLKNLSERGRNELSTLLKIAECNLHLRRDAIAEEDIARIRDYILTSEKQTTHSVKALVDEFMKTSQNIQALLLLPILGELYQKKDPTAAIDGLEKCGEVCVT